MNARPGLNVLSAYLNSIASEQHAASPLHSINLHEPLTTPSPRHSVPSCFHPMNLEAGLNPGRGASHSSTSSAQAAFASSSPSFMDSARRLLGVEARPKTWCEQMEEDMCWWCPSLTWQHRIFGCLCCFVLGLILEVGSFFRFTKLLTGSPGPFAVMYTLGNLISLAGSCFLSGPFAQAKSMFHPTRALCTAVYVLTLVLTLAVSFSDVPGQGALLVIMIIIQFMSLCYYVLSYIPFARQMVWQTCGSCLGLGHDGSLG